MFDVFNGDPPLSLKKAIVRAASDKPADLRGYMALTDSILHFIMCAPGKQPAASGVPPDFDLKSKITDVSTVEPAKVPEIESLYPLPFVLFYSLTNFLILIPHQLG